MQEKYNNYMKKSLDVTGRVPAVDADP